MAHELWDIWLKNSGILQQGYDTKPKRRLFEVLRSQGMQMNQQVTFLTDGGDDVRDLPLYLNPQAEHLLDWFHVTARITVMRQHAKGLHATDGLPVTDADTELERIKWYLWHGNVFRVMEETEALTWRLEGDDTLSASGRKLAKALDEFLTYLRNNDAMTRRSRTTGSAGAMTR